MKLINGNYSSRNAGRIYDTLRFSGLGGKTINDMEKDIILKAISEGLKEDGVMGDLGAGTGRFSLHILKMCRPKMFICLDRSKHMLALAKLKVKHSSTEFIVADVRKVPFKKNSFDLLVSMHLMKHITDIDIVLREICSVLKGNGLLIFDIANKFSVVKLRKGTCTLHDWRNILNEFKKLELYSVKIKGLQIFGESIYFVLPKFLIKPYKVFDRIFTAHFSKYATKLIFVAMKTRCGLRIILNENIIDNR